jgi:uncharacterized protein (DUF3084 family)
MADYKMEFAEIEKQLAEAKQAAQDQRDSVLANLKQKVDVLKGDVAYHFHFYCLALVDRDEAIQELHKARRAAGLKVDGTPRAARAKRAVTTEGGE